LHHLNIAVLTASAVELSQCCLHSQCCLNCQCALISMRCIPRIQQCACMTKHASSSAGMTHIVCPELAKASPDAMQPVHSAMRVHDKACSQLRWHDTHSVSRACKGKPGCNASRAFSKCACMTQHAASTAGMTHLMCQELAKASPDAMHPVHSATRLHDKACSQLCWHDTHNASKACKCKPGCNASRAFSNALACQSMQPTLLACSFIILLAAAEERAKQKRSPNNSSSDHGAHHYVQHSPSNTKQREGECTQGVHCVAHQQNSRSWGDLSTIWDPCMVV